MSTDEWRRVEELFSAALDRDPTERAGFLAAACRGDETLRRKVETLLASHQKAGGFLERPALSSGIGPATGDPPAGDAADEGAALVGRRVGRYLIRERIAAGGMGVVYLAEQENPPRQVALKVIRSDIVSPRTLRRFEREGQVLGRLLHPGIAQIFEAGQADLGEGPQPFLAMELVAGRPLVRYADDERLDHRARLDLFARVCDAVHHAHQKGIIHRDLKPANILVDRSGQPKVLDFGIARGDDPALRSTSVPALGGAIVGTVAYMSPEQVLGDTTRLDRRSDIYSLGVVCYELLSGRLPCPVGERTIEEAVRIITTDAPAPLGSIDRALAGEPESIVARALQKDPDRRYGSSADLARDIRRYLGAGPADAGRATTAPALHRLVPGSRTAAVLTGAALVAVTAIAVIARSCAATPH